MRVSFEDFIKELSKAKLILLGEIHGTKEIPMNIRKIIKVLIPYGLTNIMFEIPQSNQIYLNNFISTGKEAFLKSSPFFYKNNNQDGRNSKEYFQLIKYLRYKSMRVFFIDSLQWNTGRDKSMYRNVLKVISKAKGHSIIITGNFHASSKIMQCNGLQYKTLGYYLKQSFGSSLMSVNLIPVKGHFYNYGLKSIIPKPEFQNIKERAIIMKKEPKDKNGFDFMYIIPKVSPCSFIE